MTTPMTPREEALLYHSSGRKGKIAVQATKPMRTQHDLALAYSPGVAEPCREIAKDPQKSFEYTARGNLVAVISNGTAVLGLGNIGPEASKPVMEGKGVLFKRFADIDVFDLEVDATDPEEFIAAVRTLAPGFGGINLEDIKAPECYVIEQRLQELLDIPVFHDDQHGTAIISTAALQNALELIDKKVGEVRIVINGAGAAALACAALFVKVGANKQNIVILDSQGVIRKGRQKGMNPFKEEWAIDTELETLEQSLVDADVFVGLSKGGLVSADMVRSMARDPIVFALANPDPEISYPDAMAARDDVIVGTGRSDYPNQINNVLGFPFLFRGALDVRAREINDAMKLGAVKALAQLAKRDVPEVVSDAYGHNPFTFGREYLIPKPLDPRALVEVSSAVAEAAMESGVARKQVDLDSYRQHLEELLGTSSMILRRGAQRLRLQPAARLVFPEGEMDEILRGAIRVYREGVATPVLLGSRATIEQKLAALHADDLALEIIDLQTDPRRTALSHELYQLRKYKGLSRAQALQNIDDPVIFALMLLQRGDVDGFVGGCSRPYAQTLRPALQIIRIQDWLTRCSGLLVFSLGDRAFFLADTTVNISPNAEELAEIALCAADSARQFGAEPSVALLSFSNGGSQHPDAVKVREAAAIVRSRFPELHIRGGIQADAALDAILRRRVLGESDNIPEPNVLVFPHLDAANIAYKLLLQLTDGEGIGPLTVGLRKALNVVPQGATSEEIFNISVMTALEGMENPTPHGN